MSVRFSYTAEEIAAFTAARRTAGATMEKIVDIASLGQAGPGDLSFLGSAKYRAQVAGCRASVILLPADHAGEPGPGQVYVFVDNPSAAVAQICARIEQSLWPRVAPGIHPSAVVDPGAHVSPGAHVGPNCVVEDGAVIGDGAVLHALVYVGRNASIGENSWLMAGVVLAPDCSIGRRVRLHANVVVGGDGFGYEFVGGRHEKIPQVGRVVVEDDVEIGAGSTIDRARFSRTVIGEGTKIDNLVQVGHNVTIGKHCILCAQVGIAGSTTVEDYVVLAGQVGVAGHLTIAKGAKVGGQAGIVSDVAAGSYVNGTPAIPYMLERRIAVLQQRLPDLFRRVEILEEKLEKASSGP